MTLATILVLASAGLHAGWNLAAKQSDDRDLALVGQFTAGGVLALIGLTVTGLPGRAALPWMLASATVHVFYVASLRQAYTHGDFSFSYPMARGGGALLAAVGGVLLLGDELAPGGWIALVVVGAGLAWISLPGGSRASVGWALATAATIATYTLLDSHGSRVATSGAAYGLGYMPFTAATVGAAAVARGRGPALIESLRRTPWRHLAAGAASVAAYTLVLISVRLAPVGYVAMLRESSVVLGGAAGWLLLHERLGRRRLVGSVVIVTGLVLLVLTR